MRCWIAVFLLTLACFRGVYAGDDIRGSADVSYRSTETKTAGEKKSTWGLDQVYNLGLTKEFTPKVNFTADLGINVTESVTETDDTKTDDTKTTRLYPDMRLNVTNEYFNADTGYRSDKKDVQTMDSDEERLTTESWNHNFYTTLEKYPRVRLRYNQDRSYDDLPVHETNTQTNRFSGSADYAYRFLNFYYDYANEISDNYVADSTRETNAHDGRIDFRKSFWSNKVSSYGSYSINERETETKTRGQELRIGNAYQNIGVDLNSANQVDRIYLYTTTPDPGFDENNFTWAVYSSSDNSTWTQITSAATFNYNTIQNRFEITFTSTTDRYFKVVNTANDPNDLYVTEIEAYDGATSVAVSTGLYVQDDTPAASTLNSVPALIDSDKAISAGINIGASTTFAPYTTTEEVATTETLQANLGFKPFDWLSFTYDLNQDRRKNENEDDSTTTKQSRQYISGLLGKGFQVHKYLEIRPQYQKRLEYEKDDPEDSEEETTERSTDTYRLYFVSSPLKTLDTDLSLNHWVLQEESETQSRTSSALLHIAAKLREGADLDIDGDITRTERLSPEPESTSTSKSIRSNLRLELTSELTSELEYNMNWSETETEGQSDDTTGQTSNAEVTFYWRPSHDFYFRGSYAVDRDEESGDETSRQNYNMNWLLTKKVQLSMDYAIDRNDTITTRYSSDLSWSLSQTFTLRFGYDWSRQEADTETETQTITANLSARF